MILFVRKRRSRAVIEDEDVRRASCFLTEIDDQDDEVSAAKNASIVDFYLKKQSSVEEPDKVYIQLDFDKPEVDVKNLIAEDDVPTKEDGNCSINKRSEQNEKLKVEISQLHEKIIDLQHASNCENFSNDIALNLAYNKDADTNENEALPLHLF